MNNVFRRLFTFSAGLMLASFLWTASAQKVKLNFKDARLETVLQSIRQQTNLTLIYSNRTLDVNRRVTINASEMELRDALDSILAGSDTSYEIRDGKIYFLEKKAISAGKPIQIKGTVRDSRGEPLVGAYVQDAANPANGAVTDIDGNFNIAAADNSTLEIGFMGLKSTKVPVRGRTSISVTLEDDSEYLEEVVVIGYGSMKRKDLTGATSTVAGAEVENRKTTNLSLALQGATPGVTVTRSSGDPEATGSIRIRGITTISNSDPLVIVDGVPGKLDLINPNDVESITVLKDAASASIYGARAASGVIVVTTKRAREASLDLNYSFEYNWEIPTELPEYVGAQDYMLIANEIRYNDNPSGGCWQNYTEDIVTNYLRLNASNPDKYPIADWQNAAFNKFASKQTHSLLVSAGNKIARTKGFEFELGYRDSAGDFNWSVSANLSDFRSRITYLKGQDISAENSLVNIEGGEFNEWYGYRCLGIYQTAEDLEKYPARLNSNVGLGDLIYKDISGPEGVPDGIISPEYDRELLGGSLPRLTYGLRLAFDWKGLDFSMTFQGVGKRNVRMTTQMVQPMMDNWYNHPAILKDNYWSALNTVEENATKLYPKISTKSASNNYAMSDFWMFNGAYLRMKNISLGYSLPQKWMEKAFGKVVKKIRVYASANDLFCIDRYPVGWDPEVSGLGYPITTSVMAGISVTF